MYVSLKWLNHLINLKKIDCQKLCEKLTLVGFEINNLIEKRQDHNIDYILDINITPNRNDVANLTEISKEIISLSGKNLENFNWKFSEFPSWQYFIQTHYFFSNQFIHSNQLSYCSVLFTINSNSVFIQKSPNWIQKTLLSYEINPINNVLDITNLIFLETGYLFSLYDKSNLYNFVSTNQLDFTTNFSYLPSKLDMFYNQFNDNHIKKKSLLILVNQIPIEIVGLTQIPDVSITQTTTEFLLQGGLFDRNWIRKSSGLLEIKTKSLKLLEKELNLTELERAFIRLTYLFFTYGITWKFIFQPSFFKLNLFAELTRKMPLQNNSVSLSYKTINEIFGHLSEQKKITKQQIFTSLTNFNFKILNINLLNCLIQIPSSRGRDISREIDILEEIGRMIGFNNFISTISISTNLGKLSKLEKLKRCLKNYFLSIGLDESLNYTLSFPFSTGLVTNPKLKNPICNELTNLRSNLLDNLLSKLKLNQNRGNSLFEAFEINRVYYYNQYFNLIEQEKIGGIFGEMNRDKNWQQNKTKLHWFEAKGLIEEIFLKLNFHFCWLYDKKKDSTLFSPGKLAHFFVGKECYGYFGQINPIYAKKFNFPTTFYLFELNLGFLEKLWKLSFFSFYQAYSIYPKSNIDLSLIVPNHISFYTIKNSIYKLKNSFLKNIYLFDFYSDPPIPIGYKSLALKFQFQSNEKTLTNTEIQEQIQIIKIKLSRSFNIVFRY